jgi:hypothetical protein
MHTVYRFIRTIAVIELTLGFPAIVNAAQWQPLGNNSAFYLDTESIRADNFNTPERGAFMILPYKVAWLKLTTQDGDILLETAFNCRRGFEGYEVMQQIVANETPTSEYHSFNNTQALQDHTRATELSTVPPESIFELAQNYVCK